MKLILLASALALSAATAFAEVPLEGTYITRSFEGQCGVLEAENNRIFYRAGNCGADGVIKEETFSTKVKRRGDTLEIGAARYRINPDASDEASLHGTWTLNGWEGNVIFGLDK